MVLLVALAGMLVLTGRQAVRDGHGGRNVVPPQDMPAPAAGPKDTSHEEPAASPSPVPGRAARTGTTPAIAGQRFDCEPAAVRTPEIDEHAVVRLTHSDDPEHLLLAVQQKCSYHAW